MKRQTLALVVVGLLLFVAGGGIAFVTVVNGSKTHAGTTVGPAADMPVVVVTENVQSGLTGNDLVGTGAVASELIPPKDYVSTDISSLSELSDEELTTSLKKGEAITTADLTANQSVIAVPKGLVGITIDVTGSAGLAGYLEPGSLVDVYANIDKLSTTQGADAAPLPGNVTLPCTELLMPNVLVMDVSDIVPPLGPKASSTGRTVPGTLTFYLAVSPAQAQNLTFMSANETLAVTQALKGDSIPPTGICLGTAEYTAAP